MVAFEEGEKVFLFLALEYFIHRQIIENQLEDLYQISNQNKNLLLELTRICVLF